MDPMDMQEQPEQPTEDMVETISVPKESWNWDEHKVGEEVTFVVKGMDDDNVQLEYKTDVAGPVSDEDAMKMPLDKLESKLPKASEDSNG